MKNQISKILCFVLCFTLVFVSIVSANTDSTNQIKENLIRKQFSNLKTNISIDNDNIRKVEISNDDGTVSAVYNKKTGELTLLDKNAKEVFNANIDTKNNLNNTFFNNQNYSQPAIIASEWRLLASRTDFWFDYSYKKYDNYDNQYMWNASNGNATYTNLIEDPFNKDILKEFKSSVDAMCTHELEVIAVTSGTMVTAIVSFIALAPPTLGMSLFIAGLLALGVIAAASVPAYLVYTSKQDANYYFMHI